VFRAPQITGGGTARRGAATVVVRVSARRAAAVVVVTPTVTAAAATTTAAAATATVAARHFHAQARALELHSVAALDSIPSVVIVFEGHETKRRRPGRGLEVDVTDASVLEEEVLNVARADVDRKVSDVDARHDEARVLVRKKAKAGEMKKTMSRGPTARYKCDILHTIIR